MLAVIRKEPGIAFRVTFTNKNLEQDKYDLESIGAEVGTKLALSWHQVRAILDFCHSPQSISDIMKIIQWKDRTKFRNRFINPLIELELLARTIPGKPKSSKQEYLITDKGSVFLEMLKAKF